MNIKIESPQSVEALTEFIRFHDQVYSYRNIYWPTSVEYQLPILTRQGPYAQRLNLRPFLAYQGSKLLPSWITTTIAIGANASAISACLKRYQRAVRRPSCSWTRPVSGSNNMACNPHEQAGG